MNQNRKVMLGFKVTASEKERLKKTAHEHYQDLSTYIRSKLLPNDNI